MKGAEETGGLSSFLDEFHKKLFRANTDSHSSPPLCVRVLVRVHVCVCGQTYRQTDSESQ